MDALLTAEAKAKAFSMGSHLVGVGNIERWDKCPTLMSPKGIMPTAKAVLVCAIHHTDGMIEMGGEVSPHDQGSYSYQMLMNYHLDVMSYTMARFFEDAGYRAVPISASNIWRYRPYKNLTATFAPDMSHIYASVATGLTELGYSGLAMSPEYGPRNRFVSIITDAPLDPTPLMPGNTMCDDCGMCVKHCPTDAIDKEVKGKVAIEIEGKKYWRADKNLWRCAWAEHFGLSVDADIPEKVDEESILKNVEEIGMRGGTMGCCLKFCLPKAKRSWNKEYSSAPIRKKAVTPTLDTPERGVQERLIADAISWGADTILVESADDWKAKGVDLSSLLPDVQSVVMVAVDTPPVSPNPEGTPRSNFDFALSYLGHKCAFYIAHGLEQLGYSGAPYTAGGTGTEPGRSAARAVNTYMEEQCTGRKGYRCFLVTSAKLTPIRRDATFTTLPARLDMTAVTKKTALDAGADVVGITSAGRLQAIAEQIRPMFEDELILSARETGKRWITSSADVTEQARQFFGPSDYLDAAKSVIVLGIRMPAQSVEATITSPAEAIGPYAFSTYQSRRQLRLAALGLIKRLKGWGVNCAATYDLCGTGSFAANPRGPQPNAFTNRFAAVAAGLGTLTKGGFVRNPQFGANMRYLAIVVDAELGEDALGDLAGLRAECDAGCERCVTHCTVDAFKDAVSIDVGGTTLAFNPIEQVRCDWALRYGLVPEEGVRYTGSKSDAPIPETVTAEALAEGMKLQDTILKVRPCVAEQCMLACPYTRTQKD
ncbi:MAG: 4Fe-4S binding protein [Lentisphaerae bacterium]|nr:4Fe-4S binding protein [Lentisphaerota bacterium]